MPNFASVIIRCVQHIFQTLYGWISLFLGAIGALKDMGGQQFSVVPFPSWVWWFGALAALFVIVVRLQLQLDAHGGDIIRRFRLKKYVTFYELAEALSKVHPAYSKADIYEQLANAVWAREFESLSGHSRLHLTFRTVDGNVEFTRPIVSGVVFLQQAATGEWINKETKEWPLAERALFQAALGPPAYADTVVGALTFERPDFSRWYRRFLAGRYEE